MRTSFAGFVGACTLLILATPAPAVAQVRANIRNIRGYFVAGSTWLEAVSSFDAVAGTNRTLNIGGGAVVPVWKRIFVDVAVTRMKVGGQRVFADRGVIYPLNIPLSIRMIPLDVAGGWRLNRRISPYGAAGISHVFYNETSDFAAAGENVNAGGNGPLVLVGADVNLTRRLRVGAEARYRHVEGTFGRGGLSDVFGEESMGGLAASVRVSIGR